MRCCEEDGVPTLFLETDDIVAILPVEPWIPDAPVRVGWDGGLFRGVGLV